MRGELRLARAEGLASSQTEHRFYARAGDVVDDDEGDERAMTTFSTRLLHPALYPHSYHHHRSARRHESADSYSD